MRELIDFHVHAFTDELAVRAMDKLRAINAKPAFTDGTCKDTKEKYKAWGIAKAVLLPIATKPTQQHTINSLAAGLDRDLFIPFGTVHPAAPDRIEELHRIKELGLHGIKLHPDYQSFFLFDTGVYPIYEVCQALELPITFHMGYDAASPKVRHAAPVVLREIAQAFPKLQIIAAHLGGFASWEETLHYLAGLKNVWLDTAFLAGEIQSELFLQIIRAHGSDRILFASDCPWHNPLGERDLILSLPLTEAEQTRIFSQNAKELLRLL